MTGINGSYAIPLNDLEVAADLPVAAQYQLPILAVVTAVDVAVRSDYSLNWVVQPIITIQAGTGASAFEIPFLDAEAGAQTAASLVVYLVPVDDIEAEQSAFGVGSYELPIIDIELADLEPTHTATYALVAV